MPFLTDMYHDQNRTCDSAQGDGATPVRAAFDLEAFAARLSGRIIGQPQAVKAVARAVSIAHAGVSDPGRPLASVLLAGPTGVGKTELVRQVAAELRGGSDDMCRVDMAALAQEHYAASFSGAPPGYAGSKESFTLFDRDKIEGDPYTPGIVLFDEVEKADATVIRALLHVLDSGRLRLANGRETISFRNCFVFLTSNLGSSALARHKRSREQRITWKGLRDWTNRRSAAQARDVVITAIEEFFDAEFFNRIDETAVLDAFEPSTARQVITREVNLLVQRLARESVELQIDSAVMTYLQTRGFDPVYGARGLRRTIRTHLIAPIAEYLVQNRPQGRSPITLAATLATDHVVITTLLK